MLWNAPKHVFIDQWCGLAMFVANNTNATSLQDILHQLHHVGAFYTKFCAATKWSQVYPIGMKHIKTWVWGPMVCAGCVRCENFKHDVVARTFALIAPVRPILHRVSCYNVIVPNAPKWYEMHQIMRLGSIGVGWECSLRKIPTRLRCTNFCINCTSSAWFAPSFVQ